MDRKLLFCDFWEPHHRVPAYHRYLLVYVIKLCTLPVRKGTFTNSEYVSLNRLIFAARCIMIAVENLVGLMAMVKM